MTSASARPALPEAQLREAATRYADSVLAAAQDVVGAARVNEITHHAETLMPGLTEAPAWASLSAQLLLIEAGGNDAREAVDMAINYRALDDADDAALVLGWRLHSLFPTDAGPLPWLPDIPANLSDNPECGAYLAERSERVDDLATTVRSSAGDTAPEWLPSNVALPPDLMGNVAVWRAAHGIPDNDRRPTGPPQADFAAREHQTSLDQRVGQHLDRQGATWLKPIAEIVGRRDAHTPVLAERLASLAQQGHDVGRLLETAAREGHLPDDHATAALDSRITRSLADENRAADPSRQRKIDEARRPASPSRGGPGIGL